MQEEKWRPSVDKTFHPTCEAFFKREINLDLAKDVYKALNAARDADDLDEFMDEKDVCLRADLLTCLAYVSMFPLV